MTDASLAGNPSGALAFPAALPDGLVYEPDFITPQEELQLLREIEALPLHQAQYKQYTAKRRIASFGSAYDFGSNALASAPPLPQFLEKLRDKAAARIGLPADGFVDALVSEYQPGTTLGWHRDVPDFERVVGISLGTEAQIRFRPYPPAIPARRDVFVLDLAPRSIYALQDAIRWRWQHSIAPTRALRYSITFRTRAQRGTPVAGRAD